MTEAAPGAADAARGCVAAGRVALWRRVQLWQRGQRNSPGADCPQGRLLLCHASEPVSSTSEGGPTCCAAAPAAAAADAANAVDAAADDADAADAADADAADAGTDDATALSRRSQAVGGPKIGLARLVTDSALGGLKGERRYGAASTWQPGTSPDAGRGQGAFHPYGELRLWPI